MMPTKAATRQPKRFDPMANVRPDMTDDELLVVANQLLDGIVLKVREISTTLEDLNDRMEKSIARRDAAERNGVGRNSHKARR